MNNKYKCVNCGETIHSNLELCPYCGSKTSRYKKKKIRYLNSSLTIISIMFFIITIRILLASINNQEMLPLLYIISVIDLVIWFGSIFLINESTIYLATL